MRCAGCRAREEHQPSRPEAGHREHIVLKLTICGHLTGYDHSSNLPERESERVPTPSSGSSNCFEHTLVPRRSARMGSSAISVQALPDRNAQVAGFKALARSIAGMQVQNDPCLGQLWRDG